MDNNYLQLPNIITLEEFQGDFSSFYESVYAIFKSDFVDTKPTFQGRRLGLKRYPIIKGKEYTFYHFTHDGDVETNRLPNLRRLERITFPRPMIEYSTHPYLRVWTNKRKANNRILIFHEAESYLVVLDDRGDYILPWTAYLVEYKNRANKLIAEYEAWLKMQKSLGNT
jgi:hypothetical protein